MATPLKPSVKRPERSTRERSTGGKNAVKPSRVAKKPTTKSSAKKPSGKLSAPKLKVVAKKPNVKPASAKSQSRDTLATLRSHVDDIEKRLKRANSLTRTSVRALKTSYEALEGDTRTAELTGHIEKLSVRLKGMIEQTRQDVGHDLRIVLNDPRLETLSGALTKANQRLTAAEHQQAAAINGINAHIAKLASAVDARMQREERQRQKGEALLTVRMDNIERESANAVKSLGENIVRVSEDITEKSQTLKGELAEQTLAHQHDYAEHKHEIAERIEAIEDEQRNQLPAFERNIAKLSTRLEALEANIETVVEKPHELANDAPAFEAAPQISGQISKDAFAPIELTNRQEVSKPDQSLQAIEPHLACEAVQPGQPFAPVEYVAAAVDGQNEDVFSPRAYIPGVPGEDKPDADRDEHQAESVPTVPVIANEPQLYTQPSAEDMAVSPQISGEQSAYAQMPPPMPNMASSDEVPHIQMPEIQMLEPSMESVRPGAQPNTKSAKRKKRKKRSGDGGGSAGGGIIGGGHGMIRKVALFGGVAIIALFAYKTFAPKIFGADDIVPQGTQATQTKRLPQDVNEAPIQLNASGQDASKQEVSNQEVSNRLAFDTTAPVGDYSQTMAAPDLGREGTQARAGQRQTLEAAAADGNAIAQFQLGLSHLEAGRNADAVRLIRLSANQGQPAAQYRLAKLYEAGIGVKVNGKTTKDLLSRSANAGNRIAMHDLGHYYATGADGASPDLQQAVKWFSMAAERGVLDSQFNLAVLYQGGSGVPLSLEDAYVWYAIAGGQGDKIATQRSEAVARELSEEGLANAKSRVKAFAPKPVNNSANGIFKNLPWALQKEASARSGANTSIKRAQQMLATLGYAVGTPDGSLGPNTRNAIISFERANGLPETGRVNDTLIERLQMAVGV